jgi:hypothetical protein
MFNWFRDFIRPKKETYPTWADIPPPDGVEKNTDNIYQLPTPKLVPPMPEVENPKDNTPCYQVGKTEDGRVTLRLGDSYSYSQLTMNDEGVDCLIAMLEAAKSNEQ